MCTDSGTVGRLLLLMLLMLLLMLEEAVASGSTSENQCTTPGVILAYMQLPRAIVRCAVSEESYVPAM